MNISVFLTGMGMSLSLLVAIGAQSIFLLQQGLRNEHILAVALFCAVSDAILVTLGVAGFGEIILLAPWFHIVLRWGGVVFLIGYGISKMRSAWRSSTVISTAIHVAKKSSLQATLLTCFILTWLNPHAYLDTIVLLGSLSTQFPGDEVSFAAGAIASSFLFSFGLGFGARRLQPLFTKPTAWRFFEGCTACVMWATACVLLLTV